MSLALDERDRLFVWGDNALEQLGVSLSANTEIGTKSYVPKPKLLACMDLHAPKPAVCDSLSHVSNLREIVAAAKPEPIRLDLAHIDVGGQFTMLVFRTKPGISSSSNSSGGEPRESNSRAALQGSAETKVVTASVSKWNFSLTDDLPVSAIPSREPAYYQFMVNYKVYIRPTISTSWDEDEESEYEKERDRELQRRSPRRYDSRRSTVGHRDNLLPRVSMTSPGKRGSSANNGGTFDDGTASNSPGHVQGFDSWLDKRLNSPSRSYLAGHSFANTPRFPPPPSKEEETRSATASITSNENDTFRAKVTTNFPMKPQKPKSGFGRTVSVRRPTAFIAEPLNKTIMPSSRGSSPLKQSSNQELSPKQRPIPFGSSVESRFGPTPSTTRTTQNTPIYPEKCSIRERRAPQFTMGDAEHFSLIISRRLHQAKGMGPGPGTYDRHGG